MSSQSLGRSKMALQTMRCSGARIGMYTGPKRTTPGAHGHFDVQVQRGKEHVEVGAVPVAVGPGRPARSTARSSGSTVTPSRINISRIGSAASGGTVRFTSMSVVALGLRIPDQGDRPAELVRHPGRIEHLVERDDLGSQVAELLCPGQLPVPVRQCDVPAGRAARKRARDGNRSGSGARGGRKAETWATRPRRSMRASPGSRPWPSRPVAAATRALAAIRRERLDELLRLGADGAAGGGGGARRTGPHRLGHRRAGRPCGSPWPAPRR